MKTILVPTDFSANAQRALDYAVQIAGIFSSKIILLHSWDLPHQKSTMFMTVKDMFREKAEQEISDLKSKMLENYPKAQIDTMINMGDTGAIIKLAAEVKSVDMIIMGTKGATGLKKMFLGSTAAAVIDGAPCPVLAIPEDVHFHDLKAIAFATDFNSRDIDSIKYLVPIAKIFSAEIVITHVADSESKGDKIFTEFSEKVKSEVNYPKLSFKLFAGSDVTDSLTKFIISQNIGMLAMSKRKRGFLDRIFGKSFTKEMIEKANIPLLAFQGETTTFHPAQEPEKLGQNG
jgi:nucleotide-binding universal stress UspA family protein